MMLLRIIDHICDQSGDNAIKVVFKSPQYNKTFVTESYDSPVYAEFEQTLGWYFNQYLLDTLPQPEQAVDDKGVVAKLINFGQGIGDELLGEDHQLVSITESIEAQGYQNLKVQLESRRLAFFAELWETTILPDSKYMLSCVGAEFSRQFGAVDDAGYAFAALDYQLMVTAAAQDEVTKMLQGEMGGEQPAAQQIADKPLRVLNLVATGPEALSTRMNAAMQSCDAGDVVIHDLHSQLSVGQLTTLLADEQNPVHVLHYCGPVTLKDDQTYVTTNSESQSLLAIADLSRLMVQHKVALLCVQASGYFDDSGQPIAAGLGLAAVAFNARQNGLGNVIGLGQLTSPWIGDQCFEQLYTQISRGLSVAQAVVESRKILQTNTESTLTTLKPLPFHPWSLLLHYGVQEVQFFVPDHDLGDPNNPQSKNDFHHKLFGFVSQMLPPLLNHSSDGHALKVIDQLQQDNPAVVIAGGQGMGKSQLAHVVAVYLAQHRQIDHGFYFDLNVHDYDPTDIYQMIAPVLNLTDEQQVIEQLATVHCCFVIDGFSPDYQQQLNPLLTQLLDQGHKVLLVGQVPDELKALMALQVEVKPLQPMEQKLLAVQSLRAMSLDKLDQSPDWDVLLASLQGNAWLTKKVLPLLADNEPLVLRDELSQWLSDCPDEPKIEGFYQWQWDKLNPAWQKLLVLCNEQRGLLLEMLMIAMDQKTPMPACQSLLDMLDHPQGRFSQAIEQWAKGGFLTLYPHGRMVDARCRDFIAAKNEDCFAQYDEPTRQLLALNFSQLICEGVKQLSTHMLKQPNPNISNNLLINRREWVKHFETLWFNQDYRGFMGVKSAFDPLLQQAKIGQESQAWSFDLLKRTAMIKPGGQDGLEGQLSWLALAGAAINEPEAKDEPCLVEGALQWQQWLDALPAKVADADLPLFQQSATFLERFYNARQQWPECLSLCQRTTQVYRDYEAWQRVVQSVKSMAGYYVKNGQPELALASEQQLINDIPFDGAPAGFKDQQLMDILFARVSRKDRVNGQILLDQLRSQEDGDKLKDMLDGLQCEIHYQNGEYAAALPYYCHSWSKMVQVYLMDRGNEAAHKPQIEQLKARMLALADKVGQSEFERIFAAQTAPDSLKPQDLIL